ncbi:PAS fold-containing protein [Promicromonospora umidemergens]|uniref:PAS and ANTAR domain-containing protein n=1 Tax=Promicromonospora umidemergens TaxID=629679 RepID=A0ABP8Y047_9MICO|nr:PAS and ANTAR domain-containing protein [Promicromonospora umidemergens]MCP2286922.1 PAS fold-containing protein [Promicromonospora umidemergens]
MTAEPMEIERALTLGVNHVVGRYRYSIATQGWWWSDETFQIHGFEPGEVVPTTTLVLAHKHPEDRARVSRVLASAAVTGEPFSSVHRIMDARGRERTLTVIGRGRRDARTRQVSELVGYFVDVTAAVSTRASEAASASIRASAATRAPIEQAKGIIAFSLGIETEEAFERLRTTSNVTNVAVRDVAGRIVEMASTQKCSAADVIAVLEPRHSEDVAGAEGDEGGGAPGA